jgi:hypothetical protein
VVDIVGLLQPKITVELRQQASKVGAATAYARTANQSRFTIQPAKTQNLDRGHDTAEMKAPHVFLEGAKFSRLPKNKTRHLKIYPTGLSSILKYKYV